MDGRPVRPINRAAFLVAVLFTGMIAGAAIWAILFAMNAGISLIWDRFPTYLGEYYPVVVCIAGGAVIGLFTKRFGPYPENLPAVMSKVRDEGRYEYRDLGPMAVGAVLPLVFGGSVGPEAGLTGAIAAICTWVGDRLKRIGRDLKELTDIGMYATLSAVFGAPLFGLAGVATEGSEGTGASRAMRVLIYVFAIAGALSAIMMLRGIFGGGMDMPRYDGIVYGRSEIAWLIPLCLIGASAGWMFCVLDHAFRRVSAKMEGRPVLTATMAGAALGICGVVLPLTMFSGESQTEDLNAAWTAMSAALLLATGFAKIAVTALCVNMGWRGGHFFPVIFSGIAIGYGLAAISGIDPVFAVCATTAATVGGVMRRPLMTVLLLFLCFPVESVIVLAAGAAIGSIIPLPGSIGGELGEAPPEEAPRTRCGDPPPGRRRMGGTPLRVRAPGIRPRNRPRRPLRSSSWTPSRSA